MGKEFIKIGSGALICSICLALTIVIPSGTFIFGVMAGAISTLVNIEIGD